MLRFAQTLNIMMEIDAYRTAHTLRQVLSYSFRYGSYSACQYIDPLTLSADVCDFTVIPGLVKAIVHLQFYGGSEEQLEDDGEVQLPAKPEDSPTKDLAIVDDAETEVCSSTAISSSFIDRSWEINF